MEYKKRSVKIGSSKLKADVADDIGKRGKGLSGREKLNAGECMLFIFGYNSKHALWMRGMHFPIDVIWLDEKKSIVEMKRELQPAKHFLDFSTYAPKNQAAYVIELPAGFLKRNRVTTSTKVEF